MVLRVVIALDESQPSQVALKWACENTGEIASEVHLVTVTSADVYCAPTVPLAMGGTLDSIHAWEVQKQNDLEDACRTLKQSADLVALLGVHPDKLHKQVVTAIPGAAGVAKAVLEYAQEHHAGLLVVGSRGLGSVKRCVYSFMGLGSVSDFCATHSACPVAFVRHSSKQADFTQGRRRVCVAIDDSEAAQDMLRWTLDTFPHEDLTIVSVAPVVPYPITDETSAIVAAAEGQRWQQDKEEAVKLAEALCHRAERTVLAHKVPPRTVHKRALLPEDGTSDIGAAICHDAKVHLADVVLVGSRGLGSFKRSILSLVGLGSVSEYVAHNAPCPVVICRQRTEHQGHSDPKP
ncbi:hypothetical protein WJX72_001929 [[Myrmecia] bisecta]|uniref:UspA domain-containing protein n=1 Tax=[Myrmecia] bisecta TaxID=41462 RepID=A0AAW1PP21_9CHLO